MDRSNFIITQDNNTKNLLLNSGFQLISDNNGIYTFLNCFEKMKIFNSKEDLKFTYSNILTF